MNVHCPVCLSPYPASEPHCPRCGPTNPDNWAGPSPAPEAPSPPASSWARRLLLLLTLVSTTTMGGLVAWAAYQGLSLPEHEFWEEEPFTRPAPEIVPEEAAGRLERELRPFFKEYVQAAQARDGKSLAALYNLDEMANRAAIPQNSERDALLKAYREQTIKSAAALPPDKRPLRIEFRSGQRLPDGSVLATVEQRSKSGRPDFRRLWLVRSWGGWRICDCEDVALPLRQSASLAALWDIEQGKGVTAKEHEALLDAFSALKSDNTAKARAALALIKGPLPIKELEASRLFAQAAISLRSGQYDDALKQLDQAEEALPGLPGALLLRGAALNRLARPEKALPYLRRFGDMVGDHPDACTEIGWAHLQSRRLPQAVAMFCRALRSCPDHVEALFFLALCLEGRQAEKELLARFARAHDPKAVFYPLCERLAGSPARQHVPALCAAMRKLAPKYPPLAYFESLNLAWSRQPEKAAALFREAIARQPDRQQQRAWREGFLDAMLESGKPELAYPLLPDRKRAFEAIAPALAHGAPARLGAFVALHARDHPDDPLVPFFQALALMGDGRLDEAERSFERGLRHPPPLAALSTFRAERVRLRYLRGQALSAYRDIGPARDTFDQLVGLLLNEAPSELEALIKAHEATFPDAPELPPARGLLLVLQGKHDDAVAAFERALASEKDADRRKEFVARFLEAMREQGEPVKAYLAAPDPNEAFRVLTPRPNAPWFSALVQAHQKRSPKGPELPLHLAALLIARKDWARAALVLERYWLEHEGQHRQAWARARLLEALVRSGQTARAASYCAPGSLCALAPALIEQKRGPELLRLARAAQHRDASPVEGLRLEARAWLLLGRRDRALSALRRCGAPDADLLLEFIHRGLEREAYLACGRSAEHFLVLGRLLLRKRRSASLLRLAQEHLTAFPGSPQAHELLCGLYQARRDVRQAEWHFERSEPDKALAAAESLWFTVAKKQALAHATEKPESIPALAGYCLQLKDHRQLRRLATLQMERSPGSPLAPYWEAHALLLAGEPARAARLLQANRARLFRPASRGGDMDAGSLLIRCLVKAGRHAEARREIRWLRLHRHGSPLGEMLVHATAGDARACLGVMARYWEADGLPAAFYLDADVGPLLRSPALVAFRAKFPPPPDW